ncbi:MAG: hypothetical protein ACM32J_06130, partial [Rhizobacter sp.]
MPLTEVGICAQETACSHSQTQSRQLVLVAVGGTEGREQGRGGSIPASPTGGGSASRDDARPPSGSCLP